MTRDESQQARAQSERSARITEGPIGPTIAGLAWPMFLALMAMVGFNAVDTWYVGRLGKDELAALSFTFPVVMTVGSVSLGLGVGGAAAISRALGAGDHAGSQRLTTHLLLLGVALAIVVAPLGHLVVSELFSLLGARGEVHDGVVSYMRVWFSGLLFIFVPMAGNNALRGTGDTRTPSVIMLCALVMNMILDPLLIFGPGPFPALGLQGAAYATVASRALTLLLSLFVLHRRGLIFWGRVRVPALLRSWRTILRVGMPAAVTNVIVPASLVVVTGMIATFGDAVVAGYGVAGRIEMIAVLTMHSVASVMVPFVGQNAGAHHWERIARALTLSHRFAYGWGAAFFVVAYIAAPTFVRAFNDDPEVVRAGAAYLRFVGISYGLQGALLISSAAFNGLNKPRPAFVLAVLRMFLLYLPLAWLGSRFFGLEGIFAAGAIANGSAGLLSVLWVRRVVDAQRVNR